MESSVSVNVVIMVAMVVKIANISANEHVCFPLSLFTRCEHTYIIFVALYIYATKRARKGAFVFAPAFLGLPKSLVWQESALRTIRGTQKGNKTKAGKRAKAVGVEERVAERI